MNKKMAIDTAKRATDVRKRFSEFVDSVVHKQPQFVSRNERDVFLSINLAHLTPLIASLNYTVTVYREEDGTFTVSSKEFHPVVNANSEEEALLMLADELTEFAHDYFEDFTLYSNTPNFNKQFPFILKAMVSSPEELKGSFNVEYERP